MLPDCLQILHRSGRQEPFLGQHSRGDDFVLATGRAISVRAFVIVTALASATMFSAYSDLPQRTPPVTNTFVMATNLLRRRLRHGRSAKPDPRACPVSPSVAGVASGAGRERHRMGGPGGRSA